jgi:hypothetical protein
MPHCGLVRMQLTSVLAAVWPLATAGAAWLLGASRSGPKLCAGRIGSDFDVAHLRLGLGCEPDYVPSKRTASWYSASIPSPES